VRLAGTAALLAGAMLLLARVIRLGFLANFLSRTVLVGFLTGVGIQVAAGQLGEMLGVSASGQETVVRLVNTVRALPHVRPATAVVSLAVIVVVIGIRAVTRKVPGALLAVVAAILVSRVLGFGRYGIAVLGPVSGGLPHPSLPSFAGHDLISLLPAAASMFVVILAQSSATARAYAARYQEEVDEDSDLVGLGVANVTAALSGTFVVNGSPTKTQIVDSAGGRSQLASLACGVVVMVVLLVLTGPLAYLPLAALATVVFLIGVDLVDIGGMRRIYQTRPEEFVVALLTTAAVVFIGVEQGVLLAIVASVVDHLRHSYSPRSSLLVKSAAGHWQSLPIEPGGRTVDGLIVYRFASSLYFANAARLAADVKALLERGERPVWFCLDCAAISDVDYTASAVLTQIRDRLAEGGTRLVLSGTIESVVRQLTRYGLVDKLGPGALFDTAGEALDAFRAGAARSAEADKPGQARGRDEK
jgi:MFS superfamily sulfate permease-like transporter